MYACVKRNDFYLGTITVPSHVDTVQTRHGHVFGADNLARRKFQGNFGKYLGAKLNGVNTKAHWQALKLVINPSTFMYLLYYPPREIKRNSNIIFKGNGNGSKNKESSTTNIYSNKRKNIGTFYSVIKIVVKYSKCNNSGLWMGIQKKSRFAFYARHLLGFQEEIRFLLYIRQEVNGQNLCSNLINVQR